MMKRARASRAGLGVLALLAAAACGEDATGPDPTDTTDPPEPENVAPTIAPIADRTVVRNTLAPRGVEIELAVADPDHDTLAVSIASDDEDVVASTSFTCITDVECSLAFTPSPAQTAQATVQVTVTDGDGAEAATSFVVDVGPLLVTNATDSDPGSLRHRVTTAEPGDVIAFDTAGIFAEARTIRLLGQIVLDRTLTIEGPGADRVTLSGNDIVRVFKVTDGATVSVSGVTITDGRASLEQLAEGVSLTTGGGVFVDTGSRLMLAASVVTGNAADGQPGSTYGGGIGVFESTVIVRDSSVVSGNTASSGGGVGVISLGGSEAVAVIENSVVSDNTATSSGGGISASNGAVLVHASEIVRNTAGYGGGGIANAGGAVVIREGSTIAENVAQDDGQGGGGGIHNGSGSTTVTESDVVDNTAVANGGGILNAGTLTLTDGRVAGNTADGDDTVNQGGGGIYNSGVATLAGSTVEANQAVAGGGGIHNRDTLHVEAGSAIADNGSSYAGGGLYNDGEDATVRGSTISGNTAPSAAGIDNREVLTLEESMVSGNVADSRGGGLYHRGSLSTTAITATVIDGNTAEFGGGVYFSGEGLTLEGGTEVRDNTATEDGGGLYYHGSVIGDPHTVTIDSTMIEANEANRGGGVFFVYRSGESSGVANLRIEGGSRVAGNTAAAGAGFFQTQSFGSGGNARTVIDGSVVEQNVATGDGGGILNEGGLLSIQGASLVADNEAQDGGGIHNRPNVEDFREVETTVADATVSGNQAALGGGVYNETTFTLGSDGAITGNTATDPAPSGGGVYNLGTFTNNGDVSGNSPDNVAP